MGIRYFGTLLNYYSIKKIPDGQGELLYYVRQGQAISSSHKKGKLNLPEKKGKLKDLHEKILFLDLEYHEY